jgi:hypothetical protein
MTSDSGMETAGGDPVRDYLKQVSRVPGLTAAEEAELAKRIEAGLNAEAKLAAGSERLAPAERIDLEWVAEVGTRARNHLLEANLRLVVAVAKRFAGHGLPFPDLIQEGNQGLIQAMERFDYTRGYSFSTYATWWVRQAITRALAAAAKRPGPDDPPAGLPLTCVTPAPPTGGPSASREPGRWRSWSGRRSRRSCRCRTRRTWTRRWSLCRPGRTRPCRPARPR